jgi:hypothetical protein
MRYTKQDNPSFQETDLIFRFDQKNQHEFDGESGNATQCECLTHDTQSTFGFSKFNKLDYSLRDDIIQK